MRISIVADVHPTEDAGRVKLAILNLFPDAVGKEESGHLKMSSDDIQHLSDRISEQKIRDTAKSILLKSVRGKKIIFHLNKQAAYSGKVNFTDGDSVLGDIAVTVTADVPENFIRYMTGGSA